MPGRTSEKVPSTVAATANRYNTSAVASLTRHSPRMIAEIRRGIESRSKIASAATASGGDTIAPSVNAIGQPNPGTTACTTAATTTVVQMTRPKASNEMGRQLRRNSAESVDHAAEYNSGGSTTNKIISGSKCGCGRLRAKAKPTPPITNEIGYGMF